MATIMKNVQTNSVMTMLFWNVGKRIYEDLLHNKRADYGRQIVAPMAQQLSWSHFSELITIKDEKALLFVVAEYWTDLPPKKILEQKIHDIIHETRDLFERNKQLKS